MNSMISLKEHTNIYKALNCSLDDYLELKQATEKKLREAKKSGWTENTDDCFAEACIKI